jgi:uncharacterized Zn finger protein
MALGDTPSKKLSVADLQVKATKQLDKLKKQGKNPSPIEIAGRNIANSYLGKAWCENLEAYRDSRACIDRGRSYVRNGAVVDMQIKKNTVSALVVGGSLYTVELEFEPIPETRWIKLIRECAGKTSMIDLLQGQLPQEVAEILCQRPNGICPGTGELDFSCNCSDANWDDVCKHVAAVMYGIGHLIDQDPELIFSLRGVAQQELVQKASTASLSQKLLPKEKRIAQDSISGIFGIELEMEEGDELIEDFELDEDEEPQQPNSPFMMLGTNGKPVFSLQPPDTSEIQNAIQKLRDLLKKEDPTPSPPRPFPVVAREQALSIGKSTNKEPSPLSSQIIREDTILSYGVPSPQIAVWLEKGVLRAAKDSNTYQWNKTFEEALVEYVAKRKLAQELSLREEWVTENNITHTNTNGDTDKRVEGKELEHLLLQVKNWLAAGQSQEALVRHTGVSRAEISRILLGKRQSISNSLAKHLQTLIRTQNAN